MEAPNPNRIPNRISKSLSYSIGSFLLGSPNPNRIADDVIRDRARLNESYEIRERLPVKCRIEILHSNRGRATNPNRSPIRRSPNSVAPFFPV